MARHALQKGSVPDKIETQRPSVIGGRGLDLGFFFDALGGKNFNQVRKENRCRT